MAWWKQRFDAAPAIETSEVHIVAGSVIPLWNRLKTDSESRLRVVRVGTKDGQRIVGVEIPRLGVAKVLKSLGLRRSATEPEKIFTDILEEGDEITLAEGIVMKRAGFRGHPAIELVTADHQRFAELRAMGVINEQVRFKQRFFVPTKKAKGIPVLTTLLVRYPVVREEGTAEELLPLIDRPSAAEPQIVDLAEWILLPEQEAEDDAVSLVGKGTEVIDIPRVELPIFEQSALNGTTVTEQSKTSHDRSRRRPRPVIEEQGLLFSPQ